MGRMVVPATGRLLDKGRRPGPDSRGLSVQSCSITTETPLHCRSTGCKRGPTAQLVGPA